MYAQWTALPLTLDMNISNLSLNPSMPTPTFDMSISNLSGVCFIIVLSFVTYITVLNAKCVESDQTPQNAAPNKGVHCLLNVLFMGR